MPRARVEQRFWKMSGAGNDFIVLPHAPTLIEDPAAFVRRVCRRGLDVGADGVLFVTPYEGAAPPASPHASSSSAGASQSSSSRAGAPNAVLVHYNADGGRSDFCGNGSRCAARFAVLQGFASWPVRLQTDCGVLLAEPAGAGVRIEVPAPTEPAPRRLVVDGKACDGVFLTAGVPHFVLHVEDPSAVDVAMLGAALRAHPDLGPAGANVDFVGAPARGEGGPWRLRTFERGVEAETLACGSGAIAVAAVLAGGGVGSPIVLRPTSGIDLRVDFESGPSGPRGFHLTGEARVVYEGVLAAGGGA
jgi:diaminopimelate epimerase